LKQNGVRAYACGGQFVRRRFTRWDSLGRDFLGMAVSLEAFAGQTFHNDKHYCLPKPLDAALEKWLEMTRSPRSSSRES